MSNFIIPTQFNVKNLDQVRQLQTALITLRDEIGIDISIEKADGIFGDSTQAAVKAFQGAFGIITNLADLSGTISLMDRLLENTYQFYGSIKDDANLPVEGIIVRLYQYNLFKIKNNLPLNLLGEGTSLKDGSYHIYLTFKSSEEENEENESLQQLLENGVLKNPLCCVVKFFVEISKNEEIELFESDRFIINELKTRQDFSSEYFVYSGYSEYKLLKNRLAENKINTEKSADDENDIEYLFEKNLSDIQEISSATGINTEILMRLIFAYELSEIDTLDFLTLSAQKVKHFFC